MEQSIPPKKQGIDIMAILAMLMIARFTCSALSNIPIFTISFTFVYGTAFVAIFLLTSRRITRRELLLLGSALAYTGYVLTMSLLKGRGLFYTEPFNAYVMVFLMTIFLWAKRQPEAVRRALLLTAFLGLSFNYAYSIYVLIQDPTASRVAATGGEIARSPYDVLNAVGSFGLAYGSVSLVTAILFARRNMEKGRNSRRTVLLLMLVLAVVFVVMASFATAILLLIMATALYFASRNKTFSVLFAIAGVLLLIFHEPVGEWIMDMSKKVTYSAIVQERLHDFGEMFKTFEAAGTYASDDGGRLDKMNYSLETFLKYPVFGGYTADDGRFGNHSELADTLGKFGVVGFGLLATFFVMLYQDVKQSMESPDMKRCCTIIFLLYLLAAALNPALYSGQLVPLILLLPLISTYVQEAPKKQKPGGELL